MTLCCASLCKLHNFGPDHKGVALQGVQTKREKHGLCQWDAHCALGTCKSDTKQDVGQSASRSHQGGRLGRLQGRPWGRHITLPELPQHWVDLLKRLIDLLLELGACWQIKVYVRNASTILTTTGEHEMPYMPLFGSYLSSPEVELP